ncbi:MAG: PTS sugar transporter subunit IIA [Gammaproteobacteria bacterium]|nr:PTS sugar transporter subunit IIA [Gammaproteobacteria bacterium]
MTPLPETLLSLPATRCQILLQSKKRALEMMCNLAAEVHQQLEAGVLFDTIIEREQLGTTGFGHGVAIPHARIDGLESPVAIVYQLQQGVDFDAVDQEPVDIIFMLLVPKEATEEHIAILGVLASMLRNRAFTARMRASRSDQQLFELISNWSG